MEICKKCVRKRSETRNMIKAYYMHVWECDSNFHFLLLISGNNKKKLHENSI